MTTAPRHDLAGEHRVSAVVGVWRATLVTVVAVLPMVLVAAHTGAAPAVRGSLIGAALVMLPLAYGCLVVDAVATVRPAASLLVAMATYLLTVVVLAAAYALLSRSGLLDSAIDRRWLGLSVMGCTVVWMAVQVRGHLRQRLPVYQALSDGPSVTGAGAR